MKLLKTRNQWVASNVTYDVSTGIATSYGWWVFGRWIDGKYIFNRYHYSKSTAKHQFRVKRLLAELDVRIDYEVYVVESLTENDTIGDLLNRTDELLIEKALERKEKARERREKVGHKKLNSEGFYTAEQWALMKPKTIGLKLVKESV